MPAFGQSGNLEIHPEPRPRLEVVALPAHHFPVTPDVVDEERKEAAFDQLPPQPQLHGQGAAVYLCRVAIIAFGAFTELQALLGELLVAATHEAWIELRHYRRRALRRHEPGIKNAAGGMEIGKGVYR